MEWLLYYAHQDQCTGRIPVTARELEEAGLEPVPARVPGSFELDLMRAGKLEDLFYSTSTLKAQELEDMHVWYCTKVQIAQEDQYLHFGGIDTAADIYINGILSRSADNMFLPWDAQKGLRIGENEVVVHIRPIMLEMRKTVPAAACNTHRYGYASLYARKAAHSYGWDIMPRILTAGLWKEVTVCRKKKDRLSEVFFVTNKADIANRRAELRFFVNAELEGALAQEYSVRIEGRCAESTFCARERLWHNTHAFTFDVENCLFWWPRNAGEPNLYETTVTLLRGERVCDQYSLKLGIRTVELERTDRTDQDGNGEFCFRINGHKVFALGTNWVPLDAFHSRDLQRLPRALELLRDIGCNMVRCWGGNVYESDEFFDFCDANGIMVWQDFSMACAVYPEDDAFERKMEEEAVFQIKRLRNHASLVLWAGDNEGDMAYYSWNGYARNPNKNRLTRQVLDHAVEMHDYSRPYLASSPYISQLAYESGGFSPERHLWGPRDYFKGSFYRDTFCHFASETGYHGFPSPDSLRRFLREPEKIFREDGIPTDEYLVHCASPETDKNAPYGYRINLAWDQVVTLFGRAEEDPADFIRQSQISQAEAFKYFIEKFRIGKWKRTGIIWWNLIDGWPQVSDAVVDYYYVKKLAYYYIKRSQEPVCLMFDEPREGCIRLVGVNDEVNGAELVYRVAKIDGSRGREETVMSGRAHLPGGSSTELAGLPVGEEEKVFYLIEWERNGKQYKNHYFTNILQISYRDYLGALTACGMDAFEGF